jgi:hypothetical protein
MALSSALGAVAPDVLILYSKRWTMPDKHFDPWMYLAAMAMYVLLAAGVGTIFPYGKRVRPWQAFGVGVTLPILIAGLLSVQKGADITPRGGHSVSASFVDLISLF